VTPTRAGIAFFACWLAVHAALAQSPAPGEKQAGEWVRELTSDRHRARDRALVELARSGASAVAPLLTASAAKDPELAWRAAEALLVLGQTADNASEAAIKRELLKAGRASNASEAAVAKKLLAQWPVLRHHYAAAQLEMLGAQVVDNPFTPTTEVIPGPGGFIPAGGVFFAGIMPALADDGDEMIVEEPVVEEAIEVVEELAEATAEVPEEKPLFGDLIKVIGRAAGKAIRDEDAAGEALGERIVEAMLKDVARPRVAARDVEFLEEPPAEAVDVDGIDLVADVEFLEKRVIDEGVDVIHTVPIGTDEPAETDQLQPGTLLIGKEWRGGDAGLEYVAQLQQIHTVILRDAPLTDAALTQLRKLASLSQLRVQRTRLSSAALVKLRHQRPGMTITAVGPAMLGVAGSDHASGLLIQQVTPETGARRAGLDEQDIITKIEGLKVSSFNDVTLALYDKVPGGKVKVEYLRDGKRRLVDVVLNDRETGVGVVQPNTGGAVHPAHIHTIFRGFGGGMRVPFRMID
jgi:hypothetical protein